VRSQPVVISRAPFLLLAIAAASLAAAPATRAAQPRHLQVVRSWPLPVSGSGFYGRERVVVTVRMGTRVRTARARTGAGGAFTARFPGTRLDACALPLSITARGSRGDTARAPRPIRDCAS
jgi:hypothetical protein